MKQCKDFVISMDTPLTNSCVLCFCKNSNSEECYLVQGRRRFNVFQELKRLPFNIKSTTHFTRQGCINKCKKRRNLITNLPVTDLVSFLKKAHTGDRTDPDLLLLYGFSLKSFDTRSYPSTQ